MSEPRFSVPGHRLLTAAALKPESVNQVDSAMCYVAGELMVDVTAIIRTQVYHAGIVVEPVLDRIPRCQHGS